MPSSKKTPNLRLNNWLGSDKPKKDDFVEDNRIIDQWSAEVREEISKVKSLAEEGIASVGGSWSEQLADTKAELDKKITGAVDSTATELRGEMSDISTTLSVAVQGVANNLGAHTDNAVIHVTQAQKNAWDAGGTITGTYVGSGVNNRKITLEFEPKGGFVFAIGESIIRANFSQQQSSVWAAFFSSHGGGGGVSVQSDGFTVTHHFNVTLDGFAYKLNESSVTYAYVVWR